MKINAFHRAVLKDYADGDFAHLAEQEELTKEALTTLGDSLLLFMMIELSEEEACEDIQTGINRLLHARDDLDVALAALGVLQAEMVNRLQENQS